MPLTFYPHSDDARKGSLEERIEILMEAAERYKAVVLETKLETNENNNNNDTKKRLSPRELKAAYNWEEIAKVLKEIRELPEANKPDKLHKADLLAKLAEIYEVLRAAKMAKLEAVRIALITESNQLKGGASQFAS